MSRFTNTLLAILVSALISGLTPEAECFQRKTLKDGRVYTLQNVADRGFLTSVQGGDIVVTDQWRDISTQKWRVSKGMVYTIYMLKPVSDGPSAKVALSVGKSPTKDPRYGAKYPMVKKEPYIIGYSGNLYWSVMPGIENFYILQNYDTELCLETRGPGQPVGASPCTYSTAQLWAVHERL